jgi:hypothetical protein
MAPVNAHAYLVSGQLLPCGEAQPQAGSVDPGRGWQPRSTPSCCGPQCRAAARLPSRLGRDNVHPVSITVALKVHSPRRQ